jgi:hypothetical protein
LVHNSLVPRFDTFVRGPDGALWQRWWQNGVWHDWESLGVPMDSAPAAISHGSYIDVFYRSGPDLWHDMLLVTANTTTITVRENLGHLPQYNSPWPWGGFHSEGPLISAPAVSGDATGRMDVFAFSIQNWVIHRWFTINDGWSDWEILTHANFVGDPAAVSWGPGHIDVFIAADNGHVYDKTFDGSNWSLWQDLGPGPSGQAILYSPAGASWGPGRIDLFVVGSDQALYHRWYDSGQWSGWEYRGGILTTSPGASSWGIGRIDVAARASDNGLWHMWYDANWNGWSDWQNLAGTLTSAPAVTDSWLQS